MLKHGNAYAHLGIAFLYQATFAGAVLTHFERHVDLRQGLRQWQRQARRDARLINRMVHAIVAQQADEAVLIETAETVGNAREIARDGGVFWRKLRTNRGRP